MSRRSVELAEYDDNAMSVDKLEKNTASEASGAEEEEEEEEYEIEQILDAKRGAFPDGRMGYLVKWKGYGEEENSWVDERDTENAKELVTEFWRKNPKKKPRKSTDLKPAKRGRKSAADDEESDTASAVKKRNRRSTNKMGSSSEEEDEPPASRAKKNRRGQERTTGKPRRDSEELKSRIQDMAKYMDRESWEDLVDTVDTVERTEDGLIVFFSLKTGEKIRERGSICRKRLPQKLLSFYESNLKWRMVEAGDD